MKNETQKKRAVYLIAAVSFCAILVFNLLTPLMSDDLFYGAEVRRASGLMGLIAQEAHQYMTWNGRSVVHLLLRISLAGPQVLFRICNAIMFLCLSVCMYLQIRRREKYDVPVMLLVQLGLWFFTVDPAQTLLWQTGAVNYLWGTTIILLFMTALRLRYQNHTLGKNDADDGLVPAILFFGFGVIAGWCNENTSGGALLFVLLMILRARAQEKKAPRYLWAAAAGNFLGLLIMVLAPGNRMRSSFTEENHAGLVGMIARFQKITLVLWDEFHLLFFALALAVVVLLLLHRQMPAEESEKRPLLLRIKEVPFLWEGMVFFFLFLATSYAMVLTALTQPRAYFGAGIFLLIAVIECMAECLHAEKKEDKSIFVRSVVYGLLVCLVLLFAKTFLESGTHLGRIYRDMTERNRVIEEQAAAGTSPVTVEMLNPDYENRYTFAYSSDLSEDAAYWTNVAYEGYFEVPEIAGVPYGTLSGE